MGCSKSSFKREVNSNTILCQETRKTLNRQPNFTTKTTGKRRTKKSPKLAEGEKSKIQAEIKEREKKEKKEKTIVKIDKTKSWFFEKVNNIDKPLAGLIQKKEKNQINKIRNQKGEVTADNAEIQRIIRDYYEQLYGNKIENLEEMDIFLGKFSLPRLNQEEIEIMNSPITSTEIKAVIKNLPKNKSSGPAGFTAFFQTFREDLTPILRKLFQKIREEGTLANSFYKTTITLIPEPDKDNTQKRKLQANITDEHRCKNP